MNVVMLALDVVVRILGSLVLLGGLILLILLLWDMSHPDVDEEPDALSGVMTEKQRASAVMAAAMGFQTRVDYAQSHDTIAERLGHCYMLAGMAMLWSTDSLKGYMPQPVALIHGSWHGPTAPRRIDHAIVLLDNGQVWEPVTAGIYDRAKFETYCQWERHQIYNAREANRLMLDSGNFGPWGM